MASCFIIMPVSTPEMMVDDYGRDKDHFRHVLDHLFLPAVRSAGLDPILPTAEGSQLIHAEIVKNLETADLVLCDMSILNPNVFFELGIRTALNKPVCLVRDNLTELVPFDMSIVNNHTYQSSLVPWVIESELRNLTAHIQKSHKSSPDANALWSYFSMTLRAEPEEGKSGIEGKVDYLNLQMEGLRRQIEIVNRNAEFGLKVKNYERDPLTDRISKIAANHAPSHSLVSGGKKIRIKLPNEIPKEAIQEMQGLAEAEGVILKIIVEGETP